MKNDILDVCNKIKTKTYTQKRIIKRNTTFSYTTNFSHVSKWICEGGQESKLNKNHAND